MREAGNGDLPSENQDKEKRRRLATQLTEEMRLIRREFESTKDMGNGARFLYDFEKRLPFRHREIRYASIPNKKAEKRAVNESDRIRMAAEYAAEAGVLMVMDVLRQSRKVVFSKDWEVGYRENNVINILQKIEKKRRKKGLLKCCEGGRIDKRDVENTWKMMMDAEKKRMDVLNLISHEISLTKRSRLICINIPFWFSSETEGQHPESDCVFGKEGSEGGLTYCRTKISKMYPNESVSYENVIFPLVRDDSPPTIFNTRMDDSPEKTERTPPKAQMIERYKKYLKSFARINAKQSSRSNFNIAQPSAASHPTSQHVFKKIPIEYLRCKNAKDIINHKYKHVVVDRVAHMARRAETKYSLGDLEDGLSGDLCSSGSDDTSIRYTFLIEAALGKTSDSGKKDIPNGDIKKVSGCWKDETQGYIPEMPLQVPRREGGEVASDANGQASLGNSSNKKVEDETPEEPHRNSIGRATLGFKYDMGNSRDEENE
ncbi:hypothetical protein EROM_030850 [Encephalitozoon romaleae SJ-2008]|uniref:Uncharacterized protein n=1 Tax=Encephalitozoon romaleae (strain SJ-2008) TaxID=1178016 RepID=I6ZSY7_ENCRO|nr:hypothetical protein EROM_030850 [Encephalitozoon romaleae SJ-2008]AFN82706.1 hypothetical protein EROM_030850 [Encephalitozoon romaleae SJ-2008]